jgi:hypothetical protein
MAVPRMLSLPLLLLLLLAPRALAEEAAPAAEEAPLPAGAGTAATAVAGRPLPDPPAADPDPDPARCGRPVGAHCDPLLTRKPAQPANVRFWVTEPELRPNATEALEVLLKVVDSSVARTDPSGETVFPHSVYTLAQHDNFEPSSRIAELFDKEMQKSVQRAHPTFDDESAWGYIKRLHKSKSDSDLATFEEHQDEAFAKFVEAGSFEKRGRPSWRHVVHTRVYDLRPAFADPTDPRPHRKALAGGQTPYAVDRDGGDARAGDDFPGGEAGGQAPDERGDGYRTWMKPAWHVANDTVVYTAQTNENQQDREATMSRAAWAGLEQAESDGLALCGDASQCFASVSIEARYSVNRQVDCDTGTPLYPWTETKDGEPQGRFGSSLTLATVRVAPHEGVLRHEVDPLVRQHAYGTALGANPLTVQMASAFDVVRYGEECFMVQRGGLNRFLQGVL